MKGKDLIKFILKNDPTGELQVTVDNLDIVCIMRQRANKDGWMQNLISSHDEYGNLIEVKGAKLVGEGDKLVIRTNTIKDMACQWGFSKIEIIGEDLDRSKQNLASSWLGKEGKVIAKKPSIEPAAQFRMNRRGEAVFEMPEPYARMYPAANGPLEAVVAQEPVGIAWDIAPVVEQGGEDDEDDEDNADENWEDPYEDDEDDEDEPV